MAEFTEIHPGLAIAQGAYKDEAAALAGQLSGTASDEWEENQNGVLVHDSAFKAEPEGVAVAAFELGHDLVPSHMLDTRYFRNLPRTEGPWHFDQQKFLPLYVLYLSEMNVGSDTFQYQTTKLRKDQFGIELDPTEEEVASIHVTQGDLLRITSSGLRHRGINPGDAHRDILSIYHL